MTVPTDIAKRVYDHTFKLDPIVRSLLDTDFYKLMMLQMIWGLYRDVEVTFSLINRTTRVRIAEEIDERELRDQLDHARTLRFTKKEMIWLAGNSFYGRAHIFDAKFLAWLADFQLPDYELHRRDGQYVLHFNGPWTHTTMWEIPALAIINELRSRAALKRYARFTLDVLYARAKAKLWAKVERLRQLPGLRISDFGTRRRHGFLWQRWCVEALKEGLGGAFIGSSNVLLAMDHDLEAIGTNAHELPMVLAALADDDEALRRAPYQVLRDWQRYYARQPPGGAARHLRHHGVPARGARLDRRLDRLPAGFGAAGAGRRGDHRVVEVERPRPARQAPGVLRWARCRHHRGDLSALRRQGAHELRLGHQPHQRFRRLPAAARRRPARHLARLQGHGRQRPAGRQALGQSPQSDRDAGGDRALSAGVRRPRAGWSGRW